MDAPHKSARVRCGRAWAVTLAKLVAIVLLVTLANTGASWLVDRLEIQIWPSHLEYLDRTVLISVILYITLMAVPFMPGIEVGLALMVMLGARGVVLVYVCTLVALTISFGFGRLLPASLLVSVLRWLNLTRAAMLLEDFDATPSEERLEFLARRASKRAIPTIINHRYLVVALLLNLPGNALIGGGGGIAMMAGMSRLYAFPIYFLLIAAAILPGPILIMLSTSVQ